MKTILVFGSEGFSGRHLVSELKSRPDWKIFGADFAGGAGQNLDGYRKTDITDYRSVRETLEYFMPEYLANLAGTFTHDRNIDFGVNAGGTKNIFDAEVELGLNKTRNLLIGSSAEYGEGEPGKPIDENSPMNPQNVYGESKKEQTVLMGHYKDKLDIMMARTFNLLGPDSSENLFAGAFFRKVGSYIKGETDTLDLKDLSAYRDFLDIRDAVQAYVMILEKGIPGEVYNVASGRAVQLLDILKITCEVLDIPPEKTRWKEHPEMRGVLVQIGDIAKIKSTTGWVPKISLRETIKHIIEKLN